MIRIVALLWLLGGVCIAAAQSLGGMAGIGGVKSSAIAAGAPTSPPMTALYGWWSADQSYTETSGTPTTLITVDGTPIGSQLDRSGNGNHLYQSGGAGVQPVYKTNILNGLPAGRFDGGSTWLNKTSGGPTGNSFSIYVVANRTAAQLAGLISNNDAGLNPRYLIQLDASPGIAVYNGSTGTTAAITVTAYHLVSGSLDNTGSFPGIIRVDNDAQVSTNLAGSGNLGNVQIGKFFNRFWPGDILEVLLYTAVQPFSSGNGLLVRQYLNARYNLGLGI